jgi:PAS domain S-box-containing protein
MSSHVGSSPPAERILSENIPVPMWVYDLASLRFLAVNDAAVDRYGWSREEFLTMTIADIRPKDDASALLADVLESDETRPNAGVWRHRTRSGAEMDVEVASTLIGFGDRLARLVAASEVPRSRASRLPSRRPGPSA